MHRNTITDVREDLGSDIVDEFMEVYGYRTVEDVDPDMIYESYQGSWNSGAEFIEELCEQCGGTNGIPEAFRCYINYEAMFRDCEISGEYYFNKETENVWRMDI